MLLSIKPGLSGIVMLEFAKGERSIRRGRFQKDSRAKLSPRNSFLEAEQPQAVEA